MKAHVTGSVTRLMLRTAFVVTAQVFASTAFAQAAAPVAKSAAPSVAVSGDVAQPFNVTAADLATMPRATVSTSSNGITTEYSGVWVAEVLKKAGLPLGAGMRGKSLSGYVVMSASDGYQVLFSLGDCAA